MSYLRNAITKDEVNNIVAEQLAPIGSELWNIKWNANWSTTSSGGDFRLRDCIEWDDSDGTRLRINLVDASTPIIRGANHFNAPIFTFDVRALADVDGNLPVFIFAGNVDFNTVDVDETDKQARNFYFDVYAPDFIIDKNTRKVYFNNVEIQDRLISYSFVMGFFAWF